MIFHTIVKIDNCNPIILRIFVTLQLNLKYNIPQQVMKAS